MKQVNRQLAHWPRLNSHKLILGCGALLAAMSLQSCDKDILTGQPEWLGNSIYERLEEGIEIDGERQSFTVVLRLIDDLGQKEVLSKTGSRTLFVASDDAYAEWFKNNDWGVSSYEQLSLAQKKLLLNNSMITNAYLLELMSNVSGNPPMEGLCMRRSTAASVLDSVATMTVDEMPVDPFLKQRLDSWKYFRDEGKPIRILKDYSAPPMIHFLPEFMKTNKITARDLEILSNGVSTSINDSWINGRKVISSEQTCKNGYIYVVDGVIESNKNMADIINSEPEMSRWASLLNRFSFPSRSTSWSGLGTIVDDFHRLNNTNDSLYILKYFSKPSLYQSGTGLSYVGAYRVPAVLPFDPGENRYMYSNSMGYDEHYDAGAMIVPTNEALDAWWNNAGKGLQEEYGTWDSVPALTLSKLLNVNMLTSFVDAVPSKFNSIVDDSKVELGITEDDVVKCYMGCNGVIYLVNKVFGPSEYRSVVYPALAHQSLMGVIYQAINNYDFGPYLNSMDSRFSLVLPFNDQLSQDLESNVIYYLDPCSYGQSTQVMWEFYYNEDEQTVAANRYNCTVDSRGELTMLDAISTAPTAAQIKNRLEDLVNNLIVVGDIESGQEYYKTKAGSVIRVVPGTSGNNIRLQGGYQIETGQQCVVQTVYDMTANGNGKSYGVSGKFDNIPLTASKSVSQVLAEIADAGGDSLFFKLLSDDESTSAILQGSIKYSSTTYSCLNSKYPNVGLFENYNYTVYVPSDASIQQLINDGYLPTWEDWLKAEAEGRTKDQDSIANIIHNFVRYHIQDNSVYIGGDPVNAVKYETGKLNPKNKRFYSLEVTASATDMTVTDQLGNVRKVVKNKGNYNKTCREYWLGGSNASNRTIYTSSNAVVHQIDGYLLFDAATQLVPWSSKLSN